MTSGSPSQVRETLTNLGVIGVLHMIWTTYLLAVSPLLAPSMNGDAPAVRESLARSQPSLELDLVWIDVEESVLRARHPVTERLSRFFQSASVNLRWRAGKPQEDLQGRIAVILLPAPSRSAVLPPHTMGAVVDIASTRFVYVYYQAVLTTLGLDSSLRDSSLYRLFPGEEVRFWEALARVIAHEIVHVLVPGGQHDSSGLMSPLLTREMLTYRSFGLDEITACRIRQALGEQASCRLLPVEVGRH